MDREQEGNDISSDKGITTDKDTSRDKNITTDKNTSGGNGIARTIGNICHNPLILLVIVTLGIFFPSSEYSDEDRCSLLGCFQLP